MKHVESPMLSKKGGMPQYVTVNKLGYTMSQNYYALKYAHPSCNENVHPQIGNVKHDHKS